MSTRRTILRDHAILNDQHEIVPCDLMTWAKWLNNHAQRIVQQDKIGDVEISTVFLGLNHKRCPCNRCVEHDAVFARGGIPLTQLCRHCQKPFGHHQPSNNTCPDGEDKFR